MKDKTSIIIIVLVIIILALMLFCGVLVLNNKTVANNEIKDSNIKGNEETNTFFIIEENDKKQISNEINQTNSTDNTKRKNEVSKNEKLPQWTDTAIQDIKNIYGSNEKQIYLTFDDGPSPEVTPKILNILKQENVPATFFVLGKCVDSHPELVKQEYEDGHFIANHGYTHTYSKIYSSVENVMNEYNQANESIKKAIGNNDYNCHLFRFPGGSSGGPYDSLKSQAKKYLAENNIASTNWNCLTSDAAGNTTVQAQYKGALDTQGNKTSLIILMHDAGDKKATPETLKLLIKHYKEEGYEFKNFYSIFTNKTENIE